MKNTRFFLLFLLAISFLFSNCKSNNSSNTSSTTTKIEPSKTTQLADNQPEIKQKESPEAPITSTEKEIEPEPKPTKASTEEPEVKETTKTQIAKPKQKATPPAPKQKKEVVTPPPPAPKPKKVEKPTFKTPVYDKNNGKIVYNKTCHTCHNLGIAGAPAIQGDKKDKKKWQEIAKKDISTLSKHVKDGYTGDNGSMPPGMCIGCADKDFKDVIFYMMEMGLK